MMDDAQLAEIAARADAATPRPWQAWPSGTITAELTYDGEKYDEEICIVADGWSIRQGLDAADLPFIAAARTDVPLLLDEVARLRGIVAAVEARVVADELRDTCGCEKVCDSPNCQQRIADELSRALGGTPE